MVGVRKSDWVSMKAYLMDGKRLLDWILMKVSNLKMRM